MRTCTATLAVLLAVLIGTGCTPAGKSGVGSVPAGEVVVYTSVDQVFAEPVFKDFEAKTGIRVRAVYDAEAAKTTGLVNRLIAEKSRPRADVWWSGEIVQTLKLSEQGVLAAYRSPNAQGIPANLRGPSDMWTGFGGRARVLLYNTASKVPAPDSLIDVAKLAKGTDPHRVAVSNPVFGTASTQAAVMYAMWGPARAKSYFAAVPAAGVSVLEGNGDVRDKVVSGELDWGVADTDDALGAVEKNPAVRIIVPDQDGGELGGAILIPNTVGLVAGGPNAAAGKRLVDYLLSAETERRLLKASWIQFPVRGQPDPRITTGSVRFAPIDWAAAYSKLDQSAADMKEIYIR